MYPFHHNLDEDGVTRLAEILESLPEDKVEDAVYVLEYMNSAAELFSIGDLTFEQFKEIAEMSMKSITRLSGINFVITVVDNRN